MNGVKPVSAIYWATTVASESVAWISSKPPLIAHHATTMIAITTSTMRTRFEGRDELPVYVNLSP